MFCNEIQICTCIANNEHSTRKRTSVLLKLIRFKHVIVYFHLSDIIGIVFGIAVVFQ